MASEDTQANLADIRYLDVRVLLEDSGSTVMPAYKDTKLKVILDRASGHAPGVHKSWPLKMMNRIPSRFLNVQIHEMRLGLVEHWVSAGMPRETVLAFMPAAARRHLKQ